MIEYKLTAKQLRRLPTEEQEDAIRERLHAEADSWADYFVSNPDEVRRRWGYGFLTRPGQM